MNPITRFLANEISLHMHAMALEKLDTFAQTLHIILCISIDEFNCQTVLIVRCGFLSLKKNTKTNNKCMHIKSIL